MSAQRRTVGSRVPVRRTSTTRRPPLCVRCSTRDGEHHPDLHVHSGPVVIDLTIDATGEKASRFTLEVLPRDCCDGSNHEDCPDKARK